MFVCRTDINGIDKAMLLQELYRHAKPDKYPSPHPSTITYEYAKELLNEDKYISYIHDRQIEIYLETDTVFSGWYDLNHGRITVYSISKRKIIHTGLFRKIIARVNGHFD